MLTEELRQIGFKLSTGEVERKLVSPLHSYPTRFKQLLTVLFLCHSILTSYHII